MFLILDQENNIIGATPCERIRQQTTNFIVEIDNCPEAAVGNAKLIDGEIVYNEQDEDTVA